MKYDHKALAKSKRGVWQGLNSICQNDYFQRREEPTEDVQVGEINKSLRKIDDWDKFIK